MAISISGQAPELEKHKYPSILDTEEHFLSEEHLRINTYIFSLQQSIVDIDAIFSSTMIL